METFHEWLAENRMGMSHAHPDVQTRYWGQVWGYHAPWRPVTEVLVHRPGPEILRFQEAVFEESAGCLILRDSAGDVVSYARSRQPPDLHLLQSQHDALTDAMTKAGIRVIEVCPATAKGVPSGLNHLFTRDMGMVVPGGVVLSRFALQMRYGETRLAQDAFTRIGIPILGAVIGDGVAEGGSFTMLDEKTALVGSSIRVNASGVRQLKHTLKQQGIELVVVDLPSSLIHLDEALLMLDGDVALVDDRFLPHRLLSFLQARGITLIQVHPADPPLSANGLTIAPRTVLMPASAVGTTDRLVAKGVTVTPIDVSEINKLGGGIHCATLDLARKEDAR